MIKVRSLLFCVAIFVFPVSAFCEELITVKEVRYVMGTLLEITLHGPDSVVKDALNDSFEIAQKYDRLLSNYKDESEISFLNRQIGLKSVHVSNELWEFLDLSQKLSSETNGFFDPTIGRLFNLWGKSKSPTESEINKELEGTGIRNLIIEKGNFVRSKVTSIKIDTGGIGKGFAVDKIVKFLRTKNIRQGLVNFGRSSIYALGAPAGSECWSLKVFFSGEDAIKKEFCIKDRAITSSFTFIESKFNASEQVPHIINPLSGNLVEENIKTIVISETASLGEALSKYAVFVPCERQKKQFLNELPKITRIVNDELFECAP